MANNRLTNGELARRHGFSVFTEKTLEGRYRAVLFPVRPNGDFYDVLAPVAQYVADKRHVAERDLVRRYLQQQKAEEA